MFCSECGKEIVNDAKVCSYCGKPVQGSIQQYSSMQSDTNQQNYNNQTSNNQQNYGIQQPYNNPSYNNYERNVTFKPDNKFNLVAGLFTWIWALVKGMWDLFLADMLICFICGLLTPAGIGAILLLIYLIVRIVFVGRNANYYYRLKEMQKIPMYKAIRDPNLRRF